MGPLNISHFRTGLRLGMEIQLQCCSQSLVSAIRYTNKEDFQEYLSTKTIVDESTRRVAVVSWSIKMDEIHVGRKYRSQILQFNYYICTSILAQPRGTHVET